MISRAQYAAPTMNVSTPRTRRVRRVVGHEVARAAWASHVDRDASAAALAATRSNLYRDYRSTAL